MIDIKCACLVHVKHNKMMLVKVRDNEKYYLPGGKIESDELPKDALLREVEEELNLVLDPLLVSYMGPVTGPAYPDNTKTVLLECFRYDDILPDVSMNNEITDIQYFTIETNDNVAPAVLELFEQVKSGAIIV